MKWYEIIVKTTSEGAELVADAFFSTGLTGGVKIVDKNDILDIIKNNKNWDYIDEKLLQMDNTVMVSGFVSKQELQNTKRRLIEILDNYNVNYGEITYKEIDNIDWYDNWKQYYNPIEVGNFVIVPKWLNYENSHNKCIIRIDPGMAFGTGEHESTRICLELMSQVDFKSSKVIDIGTGSGILGIGAILNGAESCYMCDIDSIAVEAAIENATLNNVMEKSTIELADLLTQNDIKGDIIIANLTGDILIKLVNDLTKYIVKGGMIICSGIIHSKKCVVINAYKNAGFSLINEICMGEWNGLQFRYD
ncbi:MAG TPA: 50S ribosomal protein L11 methyltransferase [Clostridia bacterium]|nr:50S ribosomal protein L11 methyltransferase [Clostridia bacterium]